MDAHENHRTGDVASTVVVVTGAAPLATAATAAIPHDAVVIAADGGLDHALAAGLEPRHLVGDLDSVTSAGLAWIRAHGEVHEHPTDKSATDTELAVAFAAALRPAQLILLAGGGDRIDHAIAAIGALGSTATVDIAAVEGWWGDDHIVVARPGRPAHLERPIPTTFSVLALHGPCHGVTIDGARWPLVLADLGPVVGEGVSNEVAAPHVTVTVEAGVATVIIPGAQP